MSIILYQIPFSAPCRAVIMAARLIGVNLNLKLTKLTAGEHKKPEFLKMSPRSKVPTLDDNGFYLCESRAIMTYLVNKYGKDDSLYPKDPKQRALVDQCLYFDMGTLYQPFSDYWFSCVLGPDPPNEEKFKKIYEPLEYFEKSLDKSEFAAGDTLTIADLSLLATISTYDVIGVELSKYQNICKWLARCKEAVPDYEKLNHKGALDFKEFWDSLLLKKQQEANS